jgi:hypothetical protein
MPLVFLHGVSTRDGNAYREGVRLQQALLGHATLRGLAEEPTITHPYWGAYGARPRWNNASIPDGAFESFGAADELAATVEESVSAWPAENALLETARKSLVTAVDLAWTLVPDSQASPEVAELGAKCVAYAEANPQPAWLGAVHNDQQFLTQLSIHVDEWDPREAATSDATEPGAWESFGIGDAWGRVREGMNRLVGLPGRTAGSAVVAATRARLHGHLSLFIGDIFVYLDERGESEAPGEVPQLVIKELEEADAARNARDPHLILIGHSMGGNILYDVLTHFRPSLSVDVLVTVGSQVAVFEELKLFRASDKEIPSRPGERVPRPGNVRHWINVFDRQDVLSYVAGNVFDGVQDFEYSTGASVVGAHSTYFRRPTFHRRLNEHLMKALRP